MSLVPRKRLSANRRVPGFSIVRPSRRPRSLSSGRAERGPVGGLLRMRSFLNAIKGLPDAEERPTEPAPGLNWGRVSKHAPPCCNPSFFASVNFLTAVKAGMTKEGSGNQALSSHRYESQPSISSIRQLLHNLRHRNHPRNFLHRPPGEPPVPNPHPLFLLFYQVEIRHRQPSNDNPAPRSGCLMLVQI